MTITLTTSDWLTIIAILAAPLVAIRVEKWLERQREIREQKLRVFRTLMATRATKLSAVHVEALNMIDLTFTGKKEKAVRDRWKECLDKLANAPKPPATPAETEKADPAKTSKAQTEYAQYQADIRKWSDDLDELMANLMYEMGKSLGYDYDKVHIKRGAYIPQEHSEIELEQKAIRKGLVDLLWMRKPLPLDVMGFPGPSDAEAAEQQELRRLLIANLKGELPLPVRVIKEQ
jgi:Family of unknown function (DUF6680)